MDRNKTNMRTLAILVICLALGAITTLNAEWDYMRPPRPAKDIADVVLAVPRNVINEHGMSEKTQVYYNLFKLWELAKGQNVRIIVLEKQAASQKKAIEQLRKDLDATPIVADYIDAASTKISPPPGYAHIVDPNEVAK